MPRTVHLVVTLAVFSRALLHADDPVFSGPQPGERVTPFRVLQVAGPHSGDELKLLADDAGVPTVIIFVHEATRPGLQLMRPLDLYGVKLAKEGVVTHFVWLTPDRSKTEDWLRTARASLNLKSPVSISLDGIEGPASFGLNRKVSLTIVVAKESKVVANFAIIQPNETDAPKILDAMGKLVGKTAPSLDELRTELGGAMRRDMARPAASGRTPEKVGELSKLPDDPAALIQQLEERLAKMEKTVVELVDALNESRATIAKLQGKPIPDPIKVTAQTDKSPQDPSRRPAADLPGRTPSDPELIALMRRMIQPANDEATVKEVSTAMLRWAGDSAQREDDLRQFAKRIAHLGYGSDAAKKEINKFASDN